LELLRGPFILFVDEPTSGLSSNDSEKVMDLLKQETYNGKLVIVNIHQPSSDIFKMFDNLLVLDKGGRAIYFGNANESLVYFKSATQHVNANESECIWCGNLNPEQLLQIVETREINEKGQLTGKRMITPEDWHELYCNSIETNLNFKPTSKPIPETGFRLPGAITQFLLYFLRNLKCKIADKQYLAVNILEAPALALILGFFTSYASGPNGSYIFSENINLPAYLFMSVVVALFLGMMGSAEEIIRDARLLKRESFLNLGKKSYINSKVLYLFGVSAIQMFFYVFISHYILEIRGMLLYHWLVLFSTACFANMLGLNLSAGLRSVVAIYVLIPLMLIPQLLLSGVIVKFDKLHSSLKSDIYVPLIGDVMVSRWAYEALALEQFRNNKYETNFYEYEKSESDYTYCTNYWIPELLNRLGNCQSNIDVPEKSEDLKKELSLLRSELKSLSNHLNVSGFEDEPKLTPGAFNEPVAQKTINYLKHLRSISSKLLNRAIDEKDVFTQKLEIAFKGHNNLVSFKEKYHNATLADQMLNKAEPNKIIELKGHLYRKFEPVFNLPELKSGRAHFYAPEKKIGNMFFDAFWVDLFVIWSMCIVLYFTLIFNIFKRLINKLMINVA
jgi:energy-coupling factor transporter ATP-binding protein EcfA2